jgi:hypothetical protein
MLVTSLAAAVNAAVFALLGRPFQSLHAAALGSNWVVNVVVPF